MWRIVTDSTTDMSPEYIEQYGIQVVPISIHFNGDTYLDRVTLSEDDFYRLIEERGIIPKTSQPSPGQFVEVYTALAGQGAEAILSLHISSKLSGTYESAVQAARMVEDRVHVEVFDTFSGSGGAGLMALRAARMAEAGKSLDEALEYLAWMREVMRIYLMLDNLKFAQMSGRVTFVQQMLASMLRMKPIIAVRDGELVPADRVRTKARAMDRMVQLVADEYGHGPVHLAIMHARAPATAQQLLALARERLDVVSEMVTSLATSVAVHLGPGTVGIVAYPATERE